MPAFFHFLGVRLSPRAPEKNWGVFLPWASDLGGVRQPRAPEKETTTNKQHESLYTQKAVRILTLRDEYLSLEIQRSTLTAPIYLKMI